MTDAANTVRIPTVVEDVTPAWLTSALSAGGGAVVVTGLEIEPIGVGIGVMSLVFRLTPTYEGSAGPTSLVLKMAPPYERVRAIAAGYRFYEREVEIYRSLAGQVGLRPPRLFHAGFDAETDDFVLVLENFGGLRSSDQLTGCAIEDARAVVRSLARHHAMWWADDRLSTLHFTQSPAEPPYPQFHTRAPRRRGRSRWSGLGMWSPHAFDSWTTAGPTSGRRTQGRSNWSTTGPLR
ncbi:MAG: hypothetical protein ACRDVW_06295, partial [Acidimicrobiales bacterium]